jgi:GTPase SAR1 family protein
MNLDGTSDNQQSSETTEDSASLTQQLCTGIETVTNRIIGTVKTVADKFDLSTHVVSEKLDIDILIFGRSGVGKSQLLKAITKQENIETSPQLDHVTTDLKEAILKVDKLTYRFWDSRGIDKWSNIDADADNLINEIKEKKINPMFIIYCSAAIGRVESAMVRKLLEYLRGRNIPIAYVITNIYAGDDTQRQAQIKGGLQIMDEVFFNPPRQCDSMHYEFDANLIDNEGAIVREGHGILIGVNSCLYVNEMLNVRKSEINVNKLMDFIATNLNDEELAKFIMLTLNNRGYWEKASDVIKSRIDQASYKLRTWNIDLKAWFGALRRLWTRQPRNE